MLRGGLQVVTQRNANCKPNSPRGLWSSQLFRAFVRICDSLSLFYVSLLVLITVKGLRVATVFISNQWLSRTRPYMHLHICILSSEMTSRTIGVKALWVVQMEILNNKMTFSLGPFFFFLLKIHFPYYDYFLHRVSHWLNPEEQRWDSIIYIKYRPIYIFFIPLSWNFSHLYTMLVFFFFFF